MKVKYGTLLSPREIKDLEDIPAEVIQPLMDWMKADPSRQTLSIEFSSPLGQPFPTVGWKDRPIEFHVRVANSEREIECQGISDVAEYALAPVSYNSVW